MLQRNITKSNLGYSNAQNKSNKFSFLIFIRRSYSDLFFLQTTDLTLIGQLFTETTKTTQVKSGQGKLSARVPFPFLLFFNVTYKNRTRLKGPPFDFFGTVRSFLMSRKGLPFEFFDILLQNVC